MNLAPPNRLWLVIPAKAGIQEWGVPDGDQIAASAEMTAGAPAIEHELMQ
jgi:hypothetical protein